MLYGENIDDHETLVDEKLLKIIKQITEKALKSKSNLVLVKPDEEAQ
jgi:hypothetical protein